MMLVSSCPTNRVRKRERVSELLARRSVGSGRSAGAALLVIFPDERRVRMLVYALPCCSELKSPGLAPVTRERERDASVRQSSWPSL